MRAATRMASLLAVTAGLALTACSDSTSPIRPASLAVVGGDGDSAAAGALIELRVLVVGSDTRAFAGAVVSWTVQSGPSTLGAASTTSGEDGIATNQITLAGFGVQTVIMASVSNAGSVLLSVRSLVAAASLSVAAGDGDSAPRGDAVTLRVLVTGTDGNPLGAARVTWAVQSGPSTLSGLVSISRSDGIASNTVTLAGVDTATVILASVPNVAPLTLTVTSLDPCVFLRVLALDSVVGGALASTDCRDAPGYFYDFHLFSLPAQAGVVTRMNSTALDAFLLMFDTLGFLVAVNDDSVTGATTNSRIRALLPAGSWILGASSFNTGEVGNYAIQAQQTVTELNACEVAWAASGIAMSQQLDTTGCTTPDGGAKAADHLLIVQDSGATLTVEMNAASFAARVIVFQFSSTTNAFVPVDTADATAAGAPATLGFTAPAFDVYVYQLSSTSPPQASTYQVTVTGSASVAAGPAAPPPYSRAVRGTARGLPLPWLTKPGAARR
ncbi:MAG: hypothetical protein HY560_06315 [Gemmatimonadetes bacterium]|nr:hypothetical protein [Gemmatimonadota bacterium]